MFVAKEKQLCIPQFEHARMSFHLASLWGNSKFEKPTFDFDSFLKGVLFHDRGYGAFDDLDLMSLKQDAWIEIMQKGAFADFEDVIADIVVKKHIRRLIDGDGDEAAIQLKNKLDAILHLRIEQSGISPQAFEFADCITKLCDLISYSLCLEQYTSKSVSVLAKNSFSSECEIEYQVDAEGCIRISPWPFAVNKIEGRLLAYHAERFPDSLEPQWIPYTLVQA